MNAKLKNLKKALKHLEAAANAMADLEVEARLSNDWGMVGSACQFERQICEIISSDGGEAGLRQLVNWIAQNTKE